VKHITISFMLIVFLTSFFSTIYAQQPEKQISPPQKQRQSKRTAQQPAAGEKQQNKTLALNETKDWLTEKINGYAGVTSSQGNTTFSYRYNSVVFDRNNTFRFSETTRTIIPGWYKAKTNANYMGTNDITSTNEITLALRDIDSSNIKVSKLPDGKSFGVVIHTVSGKKKIFVKSTSTSNLNTYPAKSQDFFPMFQNADGNASIACNRLTLVFPDEEIANQVANAFMHAVNLSMDEYEPFITSADNSRKNGIH